jgi:hypothetical protein
MEDHMTLERTADHAPADHYAGALIWIDDRQARITTEATDGRAVVEWLDRGPAETESRFDARVVETVDGLDPVAVSGPTFARLAFQRVFVALTHRPELLVDLEVDAA